MSTALPLSLQLTLRRLRGAWRQALTDRAYSRQLADFQRFHASLPDPRNVTYMFFTSGLLHWLHRALKFVPPEVNVVLLGSALSADEIAWIRSHHDRPFHSVDAWVDDITVLDFILQTTRHHFGWLHIDCFVLNPEIFPEMMTLGEDLVANCIWSHPENGVETLHSAFVFLNYDAIEAVQRAGVEVSASTYSYTGSSVGRTVTDRRLYSRVPTPGQIELLRKVLPPDPTGVPSYSQEGSYFQLLVMFQLLAQALGYRLNHVRALVRDGSGSAAHYSNEIIHVNGVATYRRTAESARTVENRNYFMLLQADYTILSLMGEDLPEAYTRMKGELERELRRLGVSEEQTRLNLFSFLLTRGVSQERCAQILSAA
jgi:hypothetical protein